MSQCADFLRIIQANTYAVWFVRVASDLGPFLRIPVVLH